MLGEEIKESDEEESEDEKEIEDDEVTSGESKKEDEVVRVKS